MNLLRVEGITKYFGGLAANKDITFEVEEGELLGVIGPNGAGKTTLFEQISGFKKPSEGRVILDGKDITAQRPDKICSAGLARTFQIVKTFPELTVLENVMIGSFHRESSSRAARKYAGEVLERVRFSHKADALGKELTLAGRKRVEVARAVATRPRILLLDEAMAGLNKQESAEAVEVVRDLRQEVTVVMIEHVMEILMPLSDRIVVLVEGQKLLEGTPEEIASNPQVLAAYLGERFAARNK